MSSFEMLCCKRRWHVRGERTDGHITLAYLSSAAGRGMWVSLLEESRWRIYFFNTVLSLWVTPSPHFLSFFPRLSLGGVAWFFSQHGEAWRLSAYQPGPFILLTTCHSSPSVDRGLVHSRLIFSILVRAEKFHTDIIVSDF